MKTFTGLSAWSGSPAAGRAIGNCASKLIRTETTPVPSILFPLRDPHLFPGVGKGDRRERCSDEVIDIHQHYIGNFPACQLHLWPNQRIPNALSKGFAVATLPPNSRRTMTRPQTPKRTGQNIRCIRSVDIVLARKAGFHALSPQRELLEHTLHFPL
jgi:hypothetical protein